MPLDDILIQQADTPEHIKQFYEYAVRHFG